MMSATGIHNIELRLERLSFGTYKLFLISISDRLIYFGSKILGVGCSFLYVTPVAGSNSTGPYAYPNLIFT